MKNRSIRKVLAGLLTIVTVAAFTACGSKVNEQFMVPPRHGEYLLPKLGSDCDLLPGLGSDLEQRTIEEVEILHVEQIGLGETSGTRIGFFQVMTEVGEKLIAPALLRVQFNNLFAQAPIER